MKPQPEAENPAVKVTGDRRPVIHLAEIFSDHMVLQCERPISIWGSGTPGDKLQIHIATSGASAVVDSEGRFKVILPPLPPGGPFELVVEGTAGRVVVQDVLLGELWFCAGQSNMLWPVKNSTGADQILAVANCPKIRLRTLPVPDTNQVSSEACAGWKLCTPETADSFSAVAFLCGYELSERLQRPVGLILAAWGGTPAEAWMSREALMNDEGSRRNLLSYEACLAGDCSIFTPPLSSPRTEWAAKEFDDVDWPRMPVPRLWQDEGYFHHGVLWFRRHIQIPEAWAGRNLELNLGDCADVDQTYFNGEMIGSTAPDKPGGISPARNYTVSAKLVMSGANTLAVRVSAYSAGGGLTGPVAAMSIRPVGAGIAEAIPLAGAWRYQVETQGPMRNVAVSSWLSSPQNKPHNLFDVLIEPLMPLTICGVLWYQGEQNAWLASDYRKLFPRLMRDWRLRWGLGDFPFLYIQVPNAKDRSPSPQDSEWAELREAQSMTLSEPATAMAVTIDCGEVDLHPREKREVARRLSASALGMVYKLPVPYRSPRYVRHKCDGNAIAVEFALESDSTLKTSDGRPVRGFAVAGADRRFVWASAVIDGSSVVVWSQQVPQPVAVRYAWANNPDCNLTDSSGLPAEPFRTDSWPGLTE